MLRKRCASIPAQHDPAGGLHSHGVVHRRLHLVGLQDRHGDHRCRNHNGRRSRSHRLRFSDQVRLHRLRGLLVRARNHSTRLWHCEHLHSIQDHGHYVTDS